MSFYSYFGVGLGNKMAVVQQGAAAAVTVTDAECKLFAKIDTSADDAVVTSLNATATNIIAREMGKSFVETDWLLTMDCFPCTLTLCTGQRYFQICRTPLMSVTEIRYLDTDGTQQTLATTEYVVDTQFEPARIAENENVSWPDTQNVVNAVEVEFKSGYGSTAAAVPDRFKTIILLFFTHLYEHREAAHDKRWHEIPKHIQYMIDMEKIQVFA